MHRKMRALTNLPTSHFIRSIRLQRAAQLIEQGAGNITEIAFMVGFKNSNYFSTSFQNHFGITPTQYKKEHIGQQIPNKPATFLLNET